MGTADRLTWISRGSPFRLMTPAADLRDILQRHGYTVYDIGNQRHLEAEPPEDHTPYSETGYPGRAQYGVGYAEDIMPPARGQVSRLDGRPLPSLAQLGAQLLADRRAGVPGIRWLKYMNWEPGDGNCWHESWQPTYARRSSSDRGHIHLSGLTGFETSTIGAGYDPVARIRGGDMLTAQERKWLEATNERVRALAAGIDYVTTTWAADAKAVEQVVLVRDLRAVAGTVATVQSAITALNTNYSAIAEQTRALASAVQEIRDTPPGTVVITDEQLERVLRRIYGSVDGAVPPAPQE